MKITTIAGVLDKKELTLYKPDGTKVVLPQGDSRIQRIVDHAAPFWLRREPVEVDLDRSSVTESNPYSKYEENSNGLVKFFRVAKKAIREIFNPLEHVNIEQDAVLGEVPPGPQPEEAEAPVATVDPVIAEQTRMAAAVSQIMATAQPSNHKDFHDAHLEKTEETIIGVVDGQIIENMENLKLHFDRANKLGSATGVQNFLDRISKVIGKRRHSVEDLLKFMEKGDLPIAEDGSIVIFKRLKTVRNKPVGTFVDCHSGNVFQRVGSYVVMDESMVDPNRHADCSNGLHVARRQYLKGFSGDVCIIAKVAPEDVIAVPQYDANKMRVCAYHILFQLNQDATNAVCNDRSFSDNEEACTQLAKALSGDHIGKIEEVRITESRGGGLKITPLIEAQEVELELYKAEITDTGIQAEPLKVDEHFNPVTLNAPAVNPLKHVNVVQEEKKEQVIVPTEPEKPRTRTEEIQYMLKQLDSSVETIRIAAAKSLMEMKKKAKVSWTKLGVSANQETKILMSLQDKPATLADVVHEVQAKVAMDKKKTQTVGSIDNGVVTTREITKSMTKAEQASELFLDIETAPTSDAEAQAVKALADFKKASKKSWEYLGFSESQIKRITKLIQKQ